MNNINKQKDVLNEDRYKDKKKIKIKRLKTGMIVAIIIGTVFITCQSLIQVNNNWYNASRQSLYMDYRDGLITYEEYQDRMYQLELDLYVNLWTFSISNTVVKIALNLAFIFIIIYLLSIVLDESFERKIRMLSLGLAGIIFLFMFYPVFIGTATVYYFF